MNIEYYAEIVYQFIYHMFFVIPSIDGCRCVYNGVDLAVGKVARVCVYAVS